MIVLIPQSQKIYSQHYYKTRNALQYSCICGNWYISNSLCLKHQNLNQHNYSHFQTFPILLRTVNSYLGAFSISFCRNIALSYLTSYRIQIDIRKIKARCISFIFPMRIFNYNMFCRPSLLFSLNRTVTTPSFLLLVPCSLPFPLSPSFQ